MGLETINFPAGVTLAGGGPASPLALEAALKRAPSLLCADGGANRFRGASRTPDAIVGDLDSLEDADIWRARLGDRLVHVAEQDSTDLEKCLRVARAPLLIGVGFLGGRVDHELAALHALIADPRPVLLLGEEDVIFALRRPLSLDLPAGGRLSLFPLRRTRVSGEGLEWPVDDLELEAGGRIGTSNAVAGPVRLSAAGPGCLVILPSEHLDEAIRALSAADHAAHKAAD